MPLNIKRQVETHFTQITIEPEKYPEDEFIAYISFRDKEGGQEEYVLNIEPEDWEVLKELVDETFAQMRSHVEKVKDRDTDDEEDDLYR